MTDKEHPLIRVTVNSNPTDISADSISTSVTIRENAIRSCTLIANDEYGKQFLQQINLYDNLTIQYSYEEDNEVWNDVPISFRGKVVELNPSLTKSGEIISVIAYGYYDYPLKLMRVASEYGYQSERPSMDTLREILTKFEYGGIIPFWVEKYHNKDGGLTNSGYSINTDYICNDTYSMPYFYFPYQDAFSALLEILKINNALRFLDELYGLHFIVDVDGNMLIAPIGDHNCTGINDSCNVKDKWITKPLNDTPIVVREDMIISQFKKAILEANYILVSGKFVRPIDEAWTEGNASNWGAERFSGTNWYQRDPTGISDDSTYKMVGSYSLKMHRWLIEGAAGNITYHYYPKDTDLNIDLTKLSSKRSIPIIAFWYREGEQVDSPKLVLYAPDHNHRFELDLNKVGIEVNNWKYINIELTANAQEGLWTEFTNDDTSPDWSNIKKIAFAHKIHSVLDADVWVDGLQFIGSAIRGAYDSTLINQYGCRMLTIKNSLAMTDSLSDNDTTSPLALNALFELMRNRVMPITGQIRITLNRNLVAGQLVYIKASMLENGTYNIDKWMRITEVEHRIDKTGAYTILTLTDDMWNSIPINTSDPYSIVVRATNPDFQSKTYASVRTGEDFDISLTPITKDYPS